MSRCGCRCATLTCQTGRAALSPRARTGQGRSRSGPVDTWSHFGDSGNGITINSALSAVDGPLCDRGKFDGLIAIRWGPSPTPIFRRTFRLEVRKYEWVGFWARTSSISTISRPKLPCRRTRKLPPISFSRRSATSALGQIFHEPPVTVDAGMVRNQRIDADYLARRRDRLDPLELPFSSFNRSPHQRRRKHSLSVPIPAVFAILATCSTWAMRSAPLGWLSDVRNGMK